MKIHMILQGKGGVGKSLIAAILAQYFNSRGDNLLCADTDPVNDTFSRYESLKVKNIRIMDQANTIDTRKFDVLIEDLIAHEGTAVIDNGASTFVPLTTYIVDNGVIETLIEAGRPVNIHAVLTGGQALQDTLVGLNALFKMQTAPVIVWINEYFGPVVKDGKSFLESALYKTYKDRIKGVVTIEKRNMDTYGKDMELLVSNTLTFEEANTSEIFTLMPRSRLARVQKNIYKQLDELSL